MKRETWAAYKGIGLFVIVVVVLAWVVLDYFKPLPEPHFTQEQLQSLAATSAYVATQDQLWIQADRGLDDMPLNYQDYPTGPGDD